MGQANYSFWGRTKGDAGECAVGVWVTRIANATQRSREASVVRRNRGCIAWVMRRRLSAERRQSGARVLGSGAHSPHVAAAPLQTPEMPHDVPGAVTKLRGHDVLVLLLVTLNGRKSN